MTRESVSGKHTDTTNMVLISETLKPDFVFYGFGPQITLKLLPYQHVCVFDPSSETKITFEGQICHLSTP